MIANCKYNILNYKKMKEGGTANTTKKQVMNDDVLWDPENYPPEELIPVLKSCLDLNQAY